MLLKLTNRPVLLPLAMALVVVIVAMVAVAAISPNQAYADHGSPHAICPDPILEGNTGQIGVRLSGHKVESATFYTQHENFSAGPDDFQEYYGCKVEKKGGRKTLWAPIVTNEDTVSEHDETFGIGFWDGDDLRGCVVTILDDDAPEITGVQIISEPVDGYAYRAGDSIDFTVDLDAEVEVECTPLLAIFIGDGDDSTWRGATYHSGSGSRQLVFRYQVRTEDLDMDGISVGAAAVSDDRSPEYGFSGNIFVKDADVPIDYSHSGVKGDSRQKVDGRPYVLGAEIISSPSDGWNVYRANETIEVSMTFDTDVVVEGVVTVDIHLGLDDDNWDEAERKANYLRGSASDTLVFGYTVRPGDMDPKGVGIIMGAVFDWKESGFGGSGTIKAKGTDVERNPWYIGTGHQPDHKVDTEHPVISSVVITSSPTNGAAYNAGEYVGAEVAFSEQVTSSGEPQLQLQVGGEVRLATLVPEPEGTYSESLGFGYDVQEGDTRNFGWQLGCVNSHMEETSHRWHTV